jgi:hypothetical protein
MSPEEYQRIKEAEKEHLRKLKELKSAVRLLRRRNAVVLLDPLFGSCFFASNRL